jgi:hypothetical protein
VDNAYIFRRHPVQGGEVPALRIAGVHVFGVEAAGSGK